MTTLEEDFIIAIQDDPNDVNTRKVYADWLQDNGRDKEAMYLLFPINEVSIEFMFRVNKVIEVKCIKCNKTAGRRRRPPGAIAPTDGFFLAYCNTEDCSKRHNWLAFYFERGNTYQFNNGIYKYYGGLDNKWWEKVNE